MTRARRSAALGVAVAGHLALVGWGMLRAGEAPGEGPRAAEAGVVSVSLVDASALGGRAAFAVPAAAAPWTPPSFRAFPPLPEPLSLDLAAAPPEPAAAAPAPPAAAPASPAASGEGAAGPGAPGGGQDDPWARASLATWSPDPCAAPAPTRDPACPEA